MQKLKTNLNQFSPQMTGNTRNINMTVITHATTSAAFSYVVGSEFVTQTWLDGSGRVTTYGTDTARGRYLAGLVARKGFAKTK